MGYTHYWRTEGEVNAEQYELALTDIRKIVAHDSEILVGGMGEEGTKPELETEICFNGIEDDSHEDFYLPINPEQLQSFQFCKTARKPYDAYVAACLSILSLVEGITISSDGGDEAIKEGGGFATEILT